MYLTERALETMIPLIGPRMKFLSALEKFKTRLNDAPPEVTDPSSKVPVSPSHHEVPTKSQENYAKNEQPVSSVEIKEPEPDIEIRFVIMSHVISYEPMAQGAF